MNLSSILQRKGPRVETARPTLGVGEAARRLAAGGIGSLVILDEGGALVGVLSERDLVRALAERGSLATSLTVGELVTPHPPTCRPEDSLRDVLRVMTRRRVRHLPVLSGQALVGLVSIGDVVKGQLEDLELEVEVLRDYARARA